MYPGKHEQDKKYISKAKRKPIIDTDVFMDDIKYLQVRDFSQTPKHTILHSFLRS